LTVSKTFLLSLIALFAGCSVLLGREAKPLDRRASLAWEQARSDHAADRAQGLNRLAGVYRRPAPLTLSDPRPFLFSRAFTWVEARPLDFLPTFAAEGPRSGRTEGAPVNSPEDRSNVFLPKFDYAWGEVSFFYGKSIGSGQIDRELIGGSIYGEAGNDKTRISVGASYGTLNDRRR
jgi:hypothetical protein